MLGAHMRSSKCPNFKETGGQGRQRGVPIVKQVPVWESLLHQGSNPDSGDKRPEQTRPGRLEQRSGRTVATGLPAATLDGRECRSGGVPKPGGKSEGEKTFPSKSMKTTLAADGDAAVAGEKKAWQLTSSKF